MLEFKYCECGCKGSLSMTIGRTAWWYHNDLKGKVYLHRGHGFSAEPIKECSSVDEAVRVATEEALVVFQKEHKVLLEIQRQLNTDSSSRGRTTITLMSSSPAFSTEAKRKLKLVAGIPQIEIACKKKRKVIVSEVKLPKPAVLAVSSGTGMSFGPIFGSGCCGGGKQLPLEPRGAQRSEARLL